MIFSKIKRLIIWSLLTAASGVSLSAKEPAESQCVPLEIEKVLKPEIEYYVNSSNDTFCNLRLRLVDEFKGTLSIDKLGLKVGNLKVMAISGDKIIYLEPMLDGERRICEFVSDNPIKKGDNFQIHIPAGLLKVNPEVVEVDDIDIDESELSILSVGGAWHKPGSAWTQPGMFSVIDDDSLDGQIPSSKHSRYTYGYYSLLYPLLESLGLKGNLAIEGRKIDIHITPPTFNDNGRTLVRLQEEKGWDLLCHSMECLGEDLNNWMVDGLDSPLARKIFEEGPNYGAKAGTVSVYDLKTGKQYWPNATNTDWEETPTRFIKPYVGDYDTKKAIFYNPDYSIEWHWGEWKKRAEEFGIHPVGFVTHNSTSSHSLVPEIRKVFPNGLSDIGGVPLNLPPMLSSGVRSGLEGQSFAGYNGESKDNTFNQDHYDRFCSQIDEALQKGGWIIFNLHAYRDCWDNRLPGKLVSEGGDYPDEWVIPMKGMDSANDPLTPPSHLGISDWSEWYPCPGTRLEMMWKVLKYAKDKGLKCVTCGEGFEIMGNKQSSGYYNNGNDFGMDGPGLFDTSTKYPHYIVSAVDEVSYYNPLTTQEYILNIDEFNSKDYVQSEESGKFLISGDEIVWNSQDPAGVSLIVFDPTGKIILISHSNRIKLEDSLKGVFIVGARQSGALAGTIKLLR